MEDGGEYESRSWIYGLLECALHTIVSSCMFGVWRKAEDV
jgi:hypothetical protein